MSSKSCPPTISAQCRPSIKQLGCYTDPVIDAYGSKTIFKRKSKESLERACKRSRTSKSPTNACNQTFSGSSTSFITASCASVHTCPPDSTGETSGLPKHSSGAALVAGIKKTSGKRKSTGDESQERRKRSRRTPSPSEDPKPQTTLEASSSEKPSTSSSVSTDRPQSKAAFEAKYKQEDLLQKGGYGSVFAGHRIHDNLPVAIKHVSQSDIEHTSMPLDGKMETVPTEVALLLKLKPVAAVVTLLDWYITDLELILVLERPVPCLDLVDYLKTKEWPLQEQEVKTIAKQLVDALSEVHSRGVFHRDIKPDNILIETGSDVPRVRLIDFGCGTLISEEVFFERKGAFLYAPPEWFWRHCYMAEPTDVWQLGVVMVGMLNGVVPFRRRSDILYSVPVLRRGLSTDCNNFVLSCLIKRPEARPSLETLKNHPWLV